MAKIGVNLWCLLFIRQDALEKIMKLDKGKGFPIRIRTGCFPNLVRLVTTSRTASVIVHVYLIKCLILNAYNKATVIYIYIVSRNI